MRPLIELNNRVAALERRLAGLMRHGKVAEVNTAEGWVRMDLGPGSDGSPFLSPKIPYAQVAGGLKVHAPPTVGQQMTIIAPNGDQRQGIALPMTWSEANASPAEGGDPALTFGDVRVDLASGGLTITIGGMTLGITSKGLSVSGGDIETDQKVKAAIDVLADAISLKTHRHGGVVQGGSTTNQPV